MKITVMKGNDLICMYIIHVRIFIQKMITLHFVLYLV